MIDLYQNMNINEILDRNLRIYDFVYYGEAEVPANGQTTLTISITSDAHFLTKQITGWYETRTAAGTDGGANGIYFQIRDEGRNQWLSNASLPASFLSPGRQRFTAVAGDPSHQLFYPTEFIYPFMASSSIVITLTNSLAQANDFGIAFWGTKYRV